MESVELLFDRLTAINQNCNRGHSTHNTGAVRGLLWALNGEDPGTLSSGDTATILELAGIPCREAGDQIEHATPGDADWPKDE